MKHILLILLVFRSCLSIAQNEDLKQGIKFNEDLSWDEVIAKASHEGKLIFVDAYTTWCVPCKKMDKEIYSRKDVGDYFNHHFISVKLQVDTSQNDDKKIKSWYALAHTFQNKYNINAYPSFLFFSPDGSILHRESGYQDSAQMMQLAQNAQNPARQFYTLLNSYKEGVRNYKAMPYLARMCKDIQDEQMATIIATDFIDNYLLHLEENKLFTQDNIQFITDFTRSSEKKGFKFLYENEYKLSKIIPNHYYVSDFINWIIYNEDILPSLKAAKSSAKEPSWSRLRNTIQKKYNDDYANRAMIKGEIDWYRYKKDWPKVVKLSIEKIEKYGAAGGFGENFNLNDVAWNVIFMHSNDKQVLLKAIKWMGKVTASEPNVSAYWDTYANLLYKLGRVSEAIGLEEKALQLAIDQKDENFIKIYQDTVAKMRKGKITWGE